MKNYYGKIYGGDFKEKWIQALGKNKYDFKNPLYQNYGHIKALEKILDLDKSKFISIVCFSNQATLKIQSKDIVINLYNLTRKIKSFNDIEIKENIKDIANKIKINNIIDKQKRKKHVKDIRDKIYEDNVKVNKMICPRCGNSLILKNGKYGQFLGCSNYPKCRYTKN